MHADSHHHPNQKSGIIKTPTTRASRISDSEHLYPEIDHLRKVFEKNGYNKHTINKTIHQTLKKKENKKISSDTPKISLPYIKSTTDKIAIFFKKHNINVAFTPHNIIRKLIDSIKDPINPSLQKGV